MNQIAKQMMESSPKLLYLDVLVEITLQFIMASDFKDKVPFGGAPDNQRDNL